MSNWNETHCVTTSSHSSSPFFKNQLNISTRANKLNHLKHTDTILLTEEGINDQNQRLEFKVSTLVVYSEESLDMQSCRYTTAKTKNINVLVRNYSQSSSPRKRSASTDTINHRQSCSLYLPRISDPRQCGEATLGYHLAMAQPPTLSEDSQCKDKCPPADMHRTRHWTVVVPDPLLMDGLIDMKNKIKFPLAFTHGPQLIHHAFDDVFRCFLVILSSRDFYY